MSDASTSCSFSTVLVWVDKKCDYLPGFCIISNLFDLFEQLVFNCCSVECQNSMLENHYFSHINNKSTARCLVLIFLPIVGNLIFIFYDCSPSDKEVIAVPIERESNSDVDPIADRLQKKIEKFNLIIKNPSEPMEKLVGGFPPPSNLSHREKIDYYWLMSCQVEIGLLRWLEPLKDEILRLKNQMIQLRRTDYRKYIKTLDNRSLMEKAQTIYFESLPEEDRSEEIVQLKHAKSMLALLSKQGPIQICLEGLRERTWSLLTFKGIVAQLEKTIQSKKIYEVIEMQELILEIQERGLDV